MRFISILLVLCLLPVFSEAKKFKKAIVVAGGGFNSACGLGIVAGAMEAGFDPDVIINSCGHAKGGAFISTSKNPNDWLKGESSMEAYQAMRRVHLGKLHYYQMVARGAGVFWRASGRGKQVIPDVFGTALLEIPAGQDLNIPALSHGFSENGPGKRVVMVGSKLLFGPEDVGKPIDGKKLYREVIYTDADIAKEFEGFSAPVAKGFPESHIDSKVEVDTSRTVMEAARISLSDPYLMNPVLDRDGKSYLMGAAMTDLLPIEIAEELADEIIAPYSFPFPAGAFIQDTVGFDMEKRLEVTRQRKNVKFFDELTAPQLIGDVDFGLPHLRWGFDHDGPVMVGVPETYEDYRRQVELQWGICKEIGKQAALAKIGEKDHLGLANYPGLPAPVAPFSLSPTNPQAGPTYTGATAAGLLAVGGVRAAHSFIKGTWNLIRHRRGNAEQKRIVSEMRGTVARMQDEVDAIDQWRLANAGAQPIPIEAFNRAHDHWEKFVSQYDQLREKAPFNKLSAIHADAELIPLDHRVFLARKTCSESVAALAGKAVVKNFKDAGVRALGWGGAAAAVGYGSSVWFDANHDKRLLNLEKALQELDKK